MRNPSFRNPHILNTHRRFLDFLLWKIGYYGKETLVHAPLDFSYPLPQKTADPSLPTATWINHSTYLIKVDGLHILTDPIWSQRCSPVPFLGPKRKHPPGIPLQDLPQIDMVLISHNHYDHLDRATVLKLHRRNPHCLWLVPKRVKEWFTNLQILGVQEFSWWDEKKLENGVQVTAVPAQHFSGRSRTDDNHTLWCGWVLFFPNGKRFYFTGDTGYNSYDFKAIGEKWNGFDLSLIPIGSYLPRAFMSGVHINPQEAVKIHQDVRSHFSLAMHWKTFRLSDEPMHQPPYDLYMAMKQADIHHQHFLAVPPGYAINW